MFYLKLVNVSGRESIFLLILSWYYLVFESIPFVRLVIWFFLRVHAFCWKKWAEGDYYWRCTLLPTIYRNFVVVSQPTGKPTTTKRSKQPLRRGPCLPIINSLGCWHNQNKMTLAMKKQTEPEEKHRFCDVCLERLATKWVDNELAPSSRKATRSGG